MDFVSVRQFNWTLIKLSPKYYSFIEWVVNLLYIASAFHHLPMDVLQVSGRVNNLLSKGRVKIYCLIFLVMKI